MTFTAAILRTPASNFADGLTTVDFGKPDIGLALEQHREYGRALERCGLSLTVLPPDPRHPDSCFVEDAAVIVGATAVLTRPGAPSRAGEVEAMRGVLAERFDRREIEAPGTLDGGDVCEAGDRYFIGVSERTNEAGARQLARHLEAEGRSAVLVDIRRTPGILHLKSGVVSIDDGRRFIAIDALADHPAFAGCEIVRVAPGEEYAANAVHLNDHVLVAAGFPRLVESLESLGYRTIAVPMSEFQKMDGGLSCLSLRF